MRVTRLRALLDLLYPERDPSSTTGFREPPAWVGFAFVGAVAVMCVVLAAMGR